MKLHPILLSIPVAVATLFAAPGQAQSVQTQTQPSYSAYNYFGVGINNHDNGDSIVVEGSYAFKAPYFVSGYYGNFDNDVGGSADAVNLKLGRYFWLGNGLSVGFGVRAGYVACGTVGSVVFRFECD